MKCAVLTFATPGESFETMPRGTHAYVHFLRQFGHDVLFFDRRSCRNPLKLLLALKRWRPDVVLGQHAGAMLAGLWRKLGLLTCPVVHAWDDYYDEQSDLPAWLVRPLEKISVIGADHITSVSRYNIHRAQLWGRPTTFFPHGVTPNQRTGSLILQSSRFKVVYLGEQSMYKKMPELIGAMNGLEADLFMVGKTNPATKKVAPPNVWFMGPVPPEEVLSVLRQADVLVNSGDQDSNFKLQEYIRAEKPILGVAGRMAWVFEHGKDAWLAHDFREGLIRLMEDASLRVRLTEGVRAHRVLTWEQVVRKLESALVATVSRA